MKILCKRNQNKLNNKIKIINKMMNKIKINYLLIKIKQKIN